MTSISALFIFLVFAFLTLIEGRKKVTNPKNVPKNAILLSKVESLTLRAGKQTSSRRVSAIPQLQCVGQPKICNLYKVDVMRCTNEGADYDAENIQWACKASLPDEFKLGSTEVVCEGYESSEDPYVLKGSCGVEYNLLLTDKGEQKYVYGGQGWNAQAEKDWARQQDEPKSTIATYLFFAIFCTVLFIILRKFLREWRRRPNPPRRLGGGGGGRGGGDDDPPPPYDSHGFSQPPRTSSKTQSRSSAASSSRTSGSGQQAPRGQAQEGWRPGVWTAAAAAGAAGYFAGRQTEQRQQRRQEAMREGPFNPGRDGGGGWFGGPSRRPGGEGGNRSSSNGWGFGSSSPSADSSSSPGYSSTRHESTGFGGTRRR